MTIDYDYSVEKINKDGNSVLSNRLEKGEKLANGQTYKDELKRLGREPETSPFAQGSLTENNNPTDPVPAMTLSEDGVNSKRADDVDPEIREYAPVEQELTGTVSEDGNSTVVVDPNGEAPKTHAEDTEGGEDDEDEDEVPTNSASKQEWYDYAVKHKGLEAEYEDITQKQIVEFVGEQK